MDKTRRLFLGLAGGSVLGAVPVVRALASGNAAKLPGKLANKKWAIVIDVKKTIENGVFLDCKKACHAAHNVPDIGNVKEEIKWLWQDEYANVFPEQVHSYTEDSLKKAKVTVLCNHCERPPCVRVCPTQATWKRDDGIVMMDQHRCIGCRYCITACPYGSRSFNFKDPRPHIESITSEYPTRTKGVVEKCNFCAERLAKGKMPLCIEASNGAMIFGDLSDPDSEISKVLRDNHTIRRKPSLGTGPQVYYLV